MKSKNVDKIVCGAMLIAIAMISIHIMLQPDYGQVYFSSIGMIQSEMDTKLPWYQQIEDKCDRVERPKSECIAEMVQWTLDSCPLCPKPVVKNQTWNHTTVYDLTGCYVESEEECTSTLNKSYAPPYIVQNDIRNNNTVYVKFTNDSDAPTFAIEFI